MNATPKKILVMRYRFIGDTVLTVPFLRNLRETFPQARIDLMIEPFSGKVIEGCPYVDRVIPYEFKTIHTYINPTDRGKFSGYYHYWNMIRSERYDAVFVLKRSLSSALLVWAARVPRRIGFATEGRSMFLTDPVPYRHDQHEVENFLDCLRAFSGNVTSTALELWPSAEADQQVDACLHDAGIEAKDLKIVIHTTASLPAKEWPLDRFAKVMAALQKNFGAKFIYTGAPRDGAAYDRLEQLGPFGGLNLCGKFDIHGAISVYRKADLYFGVDSGPMHVAAAAGIPVVALFGPTDDRKWRPWGAGHAIITKDLPCHPCKPHKCKSHDCMKEIAVDDALVCVNKVVREVLSKRYGQV